MSKKNKFIWKIDCSYRNTGSKNNITDEFMRKVWVDKKDGGTWGIPNSSGIRGLAKGKNQQKIKGLVDKSAIFIVTTKHTTGSDSPWEDSIDNFNGLIKYWGDAKYQKGKDTDDWEGNKILLNVNEKRLEGNLKEIPPIFYFENEPGQVILKGMCVLENVEKKWFYHDEKRIKNYHFTLGIMDVEFISPNWIKHRARFGNDNHEDCPSEWKNFIKKGTYNRLQTWKNKIKKTEEQTPEPNSKEDKFLKSLIAMPFDKFETAIVEMLRANKITHSINQTRKTKDGGLDMEGHFELPSPLNYEIFFKGEVKRHKNSIGPGKVSRLVARLRRGEYGLFFTTSYYTKQAQEEVIEDGYPVKLFSGIDMYNLFENADMIRNGKLIDNED